MWRVRNVGMPDCYRPTAAISTFTFVCNVRNLSYF